ncbi:MAG TPA: glycosyltransferase family 2 protein [Planctomycetes bacterium]|nr:glycosyltransferase family 2 protein [Planctomycetota bacterium]
MSELVKGKATICIPNYKTLDFTRLCLRSIRKFTKYPYDVIVVDNDSRDKSLQYLKNLSWIRLIEQQGGDKLTGSYAEATALDLGLQMCNSEFFVVMHSDTFVKGDDWLAELIGYFGSEESVSCVGSGKIELTPRWRILLKKATDFKAFKRRTLREPEARGKFRYHNRTICCIYRTEVLRRENLSFLMGKEEGLTAGQKLYCELVDHGYKTVELPPSIMGQFVYHLAHATQVVNPQEFALRKKAVRKCNRILDKVLSLEIIQDILTDESLDS